MKVKVATLTGDVLDWAVELASGTFWSPNGYFVFKNPDGTTRTFDPKPEWRYSTEASQAYPIIDRVGISIIRVDEEYEGFCTNKRVPVWAATTGHFGITSSTEHQQHEEMYQITADDVVYGPTALIAAMRCYVIYELSRSPWKLDMNVEIDIPEELL